MSDHRYEVTSTSRISSRVRDVELSVSDAGLTRKVLRAEVIENPRIADNTVKVCLVHQRRNNRSDPWQDIPGAGLTATTPSSPSKFQLDTAETKGLLDHLANLFDLAEGGIRQGRVVLEIANQEEIIRTDAPRAQLIRRLVQANHSREMWQTLLDLQPDLMMRLSIAKLVAERQSTVNGFERELNADHDEQYWNQLFRRNPWMFGSQNVAIIDERRIDLRHVADLPFQVDGGYMDVVELKLPGDPFWTVNRRGENYRYRDKFLVPHPGLMGAMAQAQHYILQAEKHVADSDFHQTHGVVPLKPRGLVVLGRSADWGAPEWEAYRLLNDSLHGIQLLTYDHVLAQAKRSVNFVSASG